MNFVCHLVGVSYNSDSSETTDEQTNHKNLNIFCGRHQFKSSSLQTGTSQKASRWKNTWGPGNAKPNIRVEVKALNRLLEMLQLINELTC